MTLVENTENTVVLMFMNFDGAEWVDNHQHSFFLASSSDEMIRTLQIIIHMNLLVSIMTKKLINLGFIDLCDNYQL